VIEAHLASCTVCQDVLAAEQRLLSEIDHVLGAVGRAEPSPIFLARARAMALERPARSQESEWLLALGRWPIWALSALAGAVLIAALVDRTRPPVERSPTVASAPAGRSAAGVPLSPGVSSGPPPFVAEHSPAPAVELPSSSTTLPSREPLRPTASREGEANPLRSLAHASSGPSAIVPPGQADALVRLAALIDAGSVAPPAMLLEPPDPDKELRPPADLHFRPLAIQPLVDEGSDPEGDTL
jgi:hypothetical protein